jgi:hypothetical protein
MVFLQIQKDKIILILYLHIFFNIIAKKKFELIYNRENPKIIIGLNTMASHAFSIKMLSLKQISIGTRRLENDVYLLYSVHLQITNKYNTHIDKCNVAM